MSRTVNVFVVFAAMALAAAAVPVAAQNCAVTMTPSLPNTGQLIPNFGNSVNVTLHTASPCDQTSI